MAGKYFLLVWFALREKTPAPWKLEAIWEVKKAEQGDANVF